MRLELDAIVQAPPLGADADTKAREDSTDFAEARSSLNQGIKAAQAGNRAQARASLLRSTELDPRNENAWLWLASISEYPEELLGFLNHVLAIDPANERALEWRTQTHSLLSRTFVQRGIDAFHEGKKEFASECFQTALEHDDRNAVAWMWMASVSDSNEDKVTLLQRAASIDPENEDAAAALKDAKGSILKGRLADAKTAAVAGNNAEAIDILDDLLQVDPSSLEAWTMRSHLAESFEEKILCFDNILAIDPDNVAAKAGRDSLVAIFGAVDVVSSETEVEQAEPVNETNVVFADFGASESDGWIEQSAEPAMEFSTTAEEAESVTEPAVGEEKEDEPNYSFEEPPHSFAEEVEAPVEIDPAGEQLGIEDSPEFAFAPVIVSDEEDEEEEVEPPSTESAEYTPPVEEEITEPQPEVVDYSLAAEEVNDYSPAAEEVNDYSPAAEEVNDYSPAAEEVNYYSPAAEQVNDYSPAAEEAVDYSPAHEEVPDPQAETVAFSHSELSGDWDAPVIRPVEYGHRSDPEIPMPVVDLPPAPRASKDTSPVTFVEPRHAVHVEHEPVCCAFCEKENDAQSISCGRCKAVLTLSDLEMLLGNPHADKLLVRQAVEEMERYRLARQFTPSELVTLGVGHINLKNFELGHDCLSAASRMTPNDVVLAGQVNSLLIRLDEIRQQEEAHLRMPKGKSILVVDDSPTVRKLISGKLEKCGHDVVCANDGVEAMEKLENFLPDLVLLDINMPRMDGYQVCKLIRSNDVTKNVTVVMISGKDGFFDKVRGRMAGTTGYITKPFGPETLMKAVEMYLSGEVPDPEVEE